MAVTWRQIAYTSQLLGLDNLTDPGSDKILFWDDSDGALKWLEPNDNLDISGTNLNATGGGGSNPLTVGVDDTTVGGIYLYGPGAGSEEGGYLRLYQGADNDSTIQYALVKAYDEKLYIGSDVAADLFKFYVGSSAGNRQFLVNDGDVVACWNGNERCRMNVEETTAGFTVSTVNILGYVSLAGSASGSVQGAYVNLYLADDYNSTISYFKIQSNEDDLQIGPNTDPDALKLDSNKDLYLTDGDVYVQLAGTTRIQLDATNAVVYIGVSDTAYGQLHIYGTGAGSAYGGVVTLYTGADYDTTVNAYTVRASAEEFQIGPNTDADALKLDVNKDFYITDGDVYVQLAGSTNIYLNATNTRVGIGVNPASTYYHLYISQTATKDQDNRGANITNSMSSQTLAGATNIRGEYIYTSVTSNTLSGNTLNVVALQAEAYAFTSGGVTNLYGGYFKSTIGGTTTSSGLYGIYSLVTFGSSAAPTAIYGFESQIQCTGAVTVSLAYGFRSYNYVMGSTISDFRAYYANNTQSSGTATLGYLFYGTYSGTWGTKWGIYVTGETLNYLSGWLGIGTTSQTTGAKANVYYSAPTTQTSYGIYSTILISSVTLGGGTYLKGSHNYVYASSVTKGAYTFDLHGASVESHLYSATAASNLIGYYAYVRDADTSGASTTSGFYASMLMAGTGTHSTVQGSYLSMNCSGATTISNVYGHYSNISCSGSTLSSVQGFRSQLQHSSGTATLGYLYYGTYSGTWGTAWGIYLTGESGNYFSASILIGTTSSLTSLVGGLVIGNGTAASAVLANAVGLWCADINGAAGQAGLHMMAESEAAALIVVGIQIKGTTGDPTGHEGKMCINTNDNNVKIYAEGAWRQLATW